MSAQAAVYMDRDGAVATIHLNRPEKRNALSMAMWQKLMELVEEADADTSIKVIVVTGEGQAFAAGADIEEFRQVFSDPKTAEAVADITYRSQKRLHRNAKPTIAKIRGACVGGGCGIAICCDLRFADTTAKMGITPGKLGLIYTLADTSRLIDAVGPAKAKDILYTGRILDAEEAYRIGLIDRLVAPDALDKTVADYAEICNASQFSARGTKQIVQLILDGGADDTPATRQLFVDAFAGADFKEGFAAFNENANPSSQRKFHASMADTSFKDYVIDQLRAFGAVGGGGISARAMFGGFGVYKAGVMFGLIALDELYFKVDDSNRPEFEARKSHPFVYDGKSKPISMSYWRVPDDVLENPEDLKDWAMKAYDVALKKRAATSVAKPRRKLRAAIRRKRR